GVSEYPQGALVVLTRLVHLAQPGMPQSQLRFGQRLMVAMTRLPLASYRFFQEASRLGHPLLDRAQLAQLPEDGPLTTPAARTAIYGERLLEAPVCLGVPALHSIQYTQVTEYDRLPQAVADAALDRDRLLEAVAGGSEPAQ